MRLSTPVAAFGLVCCLIGTSADAEESPNIQGSLCINESPAHDLLDWTDPVLHAFTGHSDYSASNPYREALDTGGVAEAPPDTSAWLVGHESGSTNRSIEVVLSALLAAGCYQLVRHRHDFNTQALPSWYHDGGPFQIRHHIRYEFRTLEACLFAGQEGVQGEAPLRGVVWEATPLPRPSLVLCSGISLRGPPVI